ncbi:phage holin family protein [Nitrosomonas supralitoralis]|uniref:Phage holin family protein n=1 Tax=Nitrosomonas supralitoralis TaxID=2116706 RepID=A0A2P7NU38_9PROT|nr:phage holin family protein [Nitrosomonas supralitoralis]PSJ16955.1 phage holin family protein [Nitrosomonas supralitoralis]
MQTDKQGRTLSNLLRDLAQQTSNLVRQETELAIAEMSENRSEIQRDLVGLAMGAGLLLVGLIYILDAVVYGLAEILPPDYSPWLAALIVGMVTSLIGYMLIVFNRSSLKSRSLAPRVMNSLERDKNMVEDKING